jgi:hypothetical protein
MADPPRYPGTGAEPDYESTTGIPRWLKVVGIIVAVLVLLFVAVLLFGGDLFGGEGGGHRPGPPPGGH